MATWIWHWTKRVVAGSERTRYLRRVRCKYGAGSRAYARATRLPTGHYRA